MTDSSALTLDLHDANVWSSFAVILFLCTLLIVFGFKCRHQTIPIMQVLTILLIN